MSITLLVSVSLFALVVTSHPTLLPSDLQLNSRTSYQLESAIQAVFEVHPGKDEYTSDQARVQFLAVQQQSKYPSQSEAESNQADISFGIIPEQEASVGETFLKGSIDGSQGDSNNPNPPLEFNVNAEELGTLQSVLALAPEEEHSLQSNSDKSSSISLLALTFSCVAALLGLACIALTLYITSHLRSKLLTSRTAWHLLPRFQKQTMSSPPEPMYPASWFDLPLPRSLSLRVTGPQLDVEGGVVEKGGMHVEEIRVDAVSDMDSECDDVEEKYHDALDMTPLPPTYELPPDGQGQTFFMDPPLSYLQFESPDLPDLRTNHIAPTTGEMCSISCSSVSRPAWSVRATDAPSLGLTSSEASLVHSHRRAYRAVPEFDAALAMQLRPGLGIGADSAWMVRFLMAIFGWFAVALANNR